MKILLLSDINSAHTQKWALGLSASGFKIGIFTLSKPDNDWFTDKGIKVFGDNNLPKTVFSGSLFGKLQYLKSVKSLNKVIKDFKPDILHAHYATSYGLIGSLTKFHPFIISVWGSDVYDFPNLFFFNPVILRYILKSSDRILSTSNSMAKEISKYTNKEISVIPFGIDLNVFKPNKVNSIFNKDEIVIGTIKTLEPKYGIEFLIEAFDIIRRKHNNFPLKLLIVGGGSKMIELKNICKQKGIENLVVFTGKISYDLVADYHNMIDVYVALSVDDSESFGVAALEASACSKPVVVSDASGFSEVTKDGITGIIVPRKNAMAAANAIEKIIIDKEYSAFLGSNGRNNVLENYNWEANLQEQILVYKSVSNI
jgi:glycosyltransferase involved in cell wall biosynthesis